MIRIFAGYDKREEQGMCAFARSVNAHATEEVAIAPIHGEQRDGSNTFTYSRFMVPSLLGFKGWAIFMDASDMILRADVAELWKLRDESKAVQVVKHDYRTKHHRKYIGTRMECNNEDYPRKNWSSVILWNCAHPQNCLLLPRMVEVATGAFLHRFGWLTDDQIGELPPEWNHLVREYDPAPDAKLAHFTLGIPGFKEYAQDEFSDEWRCHAYAAERVAA